MKYYLIVGEASGDLHASNLMKALKEQDAKADFRFFGGDLMSAVGGTRVKHYKELAYMGFIPVLLHLRTIFKNMDRCKADIVEWNPDVVILVPRHLPAEAVAGPHPRAPDGENRSVYYFRKLRHLTKVAHRGRHGTSCPAVARATPIDAFALAKHVKPCRWGRIGKNR